MTKAQHTPGPWIPGHSFTTAPGSITKELTSVYSGNGDRRVADMVALRGNFEEAEANARLIAVAPELLESLIELSDYMIDSGMEHDSSAQMARAVIAKATGARQALAA